MPVRLIGSNRFGYPELRNFANLPLDGYEMRHCLDLYKIPSFFEYKLTGNMTQFYLNSFRDFDLNKCDLFHFFNTISFGKIPWITTFETSIPRWGDVSKKKVEKGLQLIAGKSCKKIVAISDCTANIQKQFVMNYVPSLYEEIIEKMIVIHPPQGVVVKDISMKPSDSIVFTMVGSGFVGKGGCEVLTVFNDILPKHSDVYLNIVSNLSDATKDEYRFCMEVIQRHDRITWYKSLPNHEVIDLFRNSHVGLLPTHAETYGYSVLEAQACACPVISTDIRALGEINNDDCGWLIELPKNGMKNAKNILRYSKEIEDQLRGLFLNILNDYSVISQKSERAIRRIRVSHDPIDVSEKLKCIYNSIL